MSTFQFTRFNSTVEKHLDKPGQFTKDYVIMDLRENLERCIMKLEALTGEHVNTNGNTDTEDLAEFEARFVRRQLTASEHHFEVTLANDNPFDDPNGYDNEEEVNNQFNH